jgi:uncharacterized protein (TIGR00255 family)
MIQSMTAFAARQGGGAGLSWAWELRGVNGRGLDLRLRLPEGLESFEPAARAALQARLARGQVALTLRLQRDAAEGLALDPAQLDRVLEALHRVQERAMALGMTLSQPTAADVLAQRGVATAAEPLAEEGLRAALHADLEALIDEFVAGRAAEGAALGRALAAQLDRIEALLGEAREAAAARRAEQAETLRAALGRVRIELPEFDEGRIAQELALIALRADVAEELERLGAHLAAARGLMSDGQPVGRRLDFLLQEFNREASTLCAKSGSARLTRIGLDLRHAIDQMREQAQNLE